MRSLAHTYARAQSTCTVEHGVECLALVKYLYIEMVRNAYKEEVVLFHLDSSGNWVTEFIIVYTERRADLYNSNYNSNYPET